MLKQEDDYTNKDMKGTDILNGVVGGWPINCCGKMLLKYLVFSILYFVKNRLIINI